MSNPEVSIQGNLAVVEVSDTPSSNTFIARYNLTPDDDEGLISFTLDFSDETGNVADQVTSTSDGSSVSFDRTNPIVEISADGAVFNNAFEIGLTFSEAVTGLETSDFITTNSAISNLTGSGTEYTALVTPVEEGSLTIQIGTGTVDAAGNNNEQSETFNANYDITAPTVQLTLQGESPTNTDISIEIAFSESIPSFDGEDLSITNGTLTNLVAENGNIIATISPTTDGEVVVEVLAGAFVDLAGNGNAASNTVNINYDATAPTAEISTTASAIVNSAFDITISFNEEVTGFTAEDFETVNATIENFAGEGMEYTATVTPVEIGLVSVSIPANSTSDIAENENEASNILQVEFDDSALTVA